MEKRGRIQGAPHGSDSGDGSDAPSIGVVVGVVVVGVIVVVILLVLMPRLVKRRRILYQQRFENDMTLRADALKRENEKREAEEGDTASGSQIWFSRYIERGKLRHWVLIINGKKYELRRVKDTKHFESKVAYDAAWSAKQEKRQANLHNNDHLLPHADAYYICLIGWTQLNAEELERIAQQTFDGFGRYNLAWNNCQTFLKDFADRIICKKALDWVWFHDNMKTAYQQRQKMPVTPKQREAADVARMTNAQQMINNQVMMANTAGAVYVTQLYGA